jgi:phospholipid/cholesterol/gamma-HCH transport system substrate-binding protein
MKRANEALVGASVLIAIALVVAGSVWLSGAHFGRNGVLENVRVKSIGGLSVGDPVLLRGVRIGRVEGIQLASNDWVNVALRLQAGGWKKPERPVALFSAMTLFGDWSVQITSQDNLTDPEVLKAVNEASRFGHDKIPGAALPDVGQLTAQAGRIAGDIAMISSRVQDAFDSSSAARLKGAFRDLSRLSAVLKTIAQGQESTLTHIGGNLDTGTVLLARSARSIAAAASRVDSATSRDQLQRILGHTDTITSDLTTVAGKVRELAISAANQQEAFERIIARTDSMLLRIQQGEGTLGRLSRDSTLYHEAVQSIRSLDSLLTDVRKNPRRYFTFSVF